MFALFLSSFLFKRYIIVAKKYNLYKGYNDRSSHSGQVYTGSGILLAFVLLVADIVLDTISIFDFNSINIVITSSVLVAILGFYDRANNLKNLPVQTLSTIVSRVTYPVFAEFKDDNIRLKNAYKKVIQLLVFIVAPLLLILSVLAEPLFRFLFTDKWLQEVPYFQILCWSGILYPIHAFNLSHHLCGSSASHRKKVSSIFCRTS